MVKIIKYDVIVVGAGPAGLFAAIELGRQGKQVLLLEKNNEAGKKLLLSGAGQCNVTHAGDIAKYENHYGDGYKYIKRALQEFTNKDTIDFFQSLGLEMESLANGKVFPKTRSARNVLDVLLNECAKHKVEIAYGQSVSHVSREGGLYLVETNKESYTSKVVVIATGGISYPKTGSTGDGYKLGYELGHKIVKPLPALAPVEIEAFPFRDLAGISLEDLHFSLWRNNIKIKDFTGDILFTHKGLSGPGIINNSRWMRNADEIRLSFIQNVNIKEFNKTLLKEMDKNGKDMIKTILRKQDLPKRLLDAVLSYVDIPEETQCAQIDKTSRSLLVKALLEFPVIIAKVGGFHLAMATAGGINMKQINPTTMESRLNKNLYFIGEVLDIDGDTGGYNIQAALSTGWLCANAIKEKVKR